MASSRDDFIIAIRSAFLKKSTQQKFSLLSLLSISIAIIILSSLDFKIIKYLKIGLNEIVYRSSFIVSIPENFLRNTSEDIIEYTTFYNNFKKEQNELDELKSKNISSEIIQFENKELKELINDYVSSSNKILAKIIVDHDSPFLKSIIINKGSKDNIKIGTNIFDQSYLVGRVIEVNYKTSRVLLLSDLNSNVPATIAPQNIQTIVSGRGDNYGQIKYIKDGFSDELSEESIIYTSGTGALFRSGIPIGKLEAKEKGLNNKFLVNFYSDFSQLKYVFAEIIIKTEIDNISKEKPELSSLNKNPLEAKLKILEDEKSIIEDSNLKFQEENDYLKIKINDLDNMIFKLKNEIILQKQNIKKFDINKNELEFLRLNLSYGHKCRKTFLNTNGFIVGTEDYKKCVLNLGDKN